MSSDAVHDVPERFRVGGECLVCLGRGLAPRYLDLLRCPACGFVTARLDRPFNSGDIYKDDYFTGAEYLDYRADEPFFRRNFQHRLIEIRSRQSEGRLLEIGSAYGFFLDVARQSYETVGFEIGEEASEFARRRFGLDVRSQEFLATDPASLGEPFDIAVMWDVIEHLEHPDRVIERIADVSRPGASLYLTTGDIGSLTARVRGRRWRMIHPPSHLHYFSRATIARLLERCGYRILQQRSDAVARSWHQVFYSLFMLKVRLPGVYRALCGLVPRDRGLKLNLFDIMFVAAERK